MSIYAIYPAFRHIEHLLNSESKYTHIPRHMIISIERTYRHQAKYPLLSGVKVSAIYLYPYERELLLLCRPDGEIVYGNLEKFKVSLQNKEAQLCPCAYEHHHEKY